MNGSSCWRQAHALAVVVAMALAGSPAFAQLTLNSLTDASPRLSPNLAEVGSGSFAVTITFNTFEGNRTLNATVILASGSAVFHNNNLLSNDTPVELHLINPTLDPKDLDASNNFWDTASASAIANRIFDFSDTFATTHGAVTFQPFLSNAEPQAPKPRAAVNSISAGTGIPGATVTATITGQYLSGATAVVFSGSGVTASIGTNTDTSLAIAITISSTAAIGARTFTVTTPAGTSLPFSGFIVNSP